MKALLDFLYVRGIKNFELPPTLDQGIKDSFEKAQAARAEGANKKSQDNDKKRPYEQQQQEPAPQNVIGGEELPEIISNPGDQHWLENSDELKPKKLKTATRRKRALKKPWMKWKPGWRNQKASRKTAVISAMKKLPDSVTL